MFCNYSYAYRAGPYSNMIKFKCKYQSLYMAVRYQVQNRGTYQNYVQSLVGYCSKTSRTNLRIGGACPHSPFWLRVTIFSPSFFLHIVIIFTREKGNLWSKADICSHQRARFTFVEKQHRLHHWKFSSHYTLLHGPQMTQLRSRLTWKIGYK